MVGSLTVDCVAAYTISAPAQWSVPLPDHTKASAACRRAPLPTHFPLQETKIMARFELDRRFGRGSATTARGQGFWALRAFLGARAGECRATMPWLGRAKNCKLQLHATVPLEGTPELDQTIRRLHPKLDSTVQWYLEHVRRFSRTIPVVRARAVAACSARSTTRRWASHSGVELTHGFHFMEQ